MPSDLIAVRTPEKVGEGMKQFVLYTVSSGSSEVRRRFSDFAWLYESLVENFKGAVVPLPPEKVQLGRFEDAFLQARCRALTRFLNRITQNTELAQSREFTAFLTAENEAFQIEKATRIVGNHPTAVADAAEQMGSWFSSALSRVGDAVKKQHGALPAQGGVFGTQPPADLHNPWAEDPDIIEFGNYADYATVLELQLQNVARHGTAMIMKQREWSNSLGTCGTAMKTLSDADLDRTSSVFNQLGFTLEKAGSASVDSNSELMEQFAEAIQDAARSVRAVKLALKQRIAVRKAAAQATSRVQMRTQNAKRLRTQPGKEDKARQAQRAAEEAQTWATEAAETVAVVTQRARRDIAQFKVDHAAEVQECIQALARLQLRMGQDLVSAWSISLKSAEESTAASPHLRDASAPPAKPEGDLDDLEGEDGSFSV